MRSNYIFFTIIVALFINVNAQSDNNDINRLKLSPVVLPQAKAIPTESHSLLINKMNQIVASNGMSANTSSSRFIITPNVAILNKEIFSGAPMLHSIKLDVTFYVGDIVSGTKFSMASIEVIGTGTSEEKAFIQALNKIKTDDEKITKALNLGKTKIVDYYTKNCDIILKQATAMASKRNYDEAIFNLISIPDVCEACYNKAVDAIKPIFKEKIDYECGINLNNANNAWNSNQSYKGAEQAGVYLSKIDPSASCYKEAQALRDKINKRIQDVDKREWDYKWESEVGITKELIQAYRDIGVAWGENQPQTITTTYNVLWW